MSPGLAASVARACLTQINTANERSAPDIRRGRRRRERQQQSIAMETLVRRVRVRLQVGRALRTFAPAQGDPGKVDITDLTETPRESSTHYLPHHHVLAGF